MMQQQDLVSPTLRPWMLREAKGRVTRPDHMVLNCGLPHCKHYGEGYGKTQGR